MAQEPPLKEQLETLAQTALISAMLCSEILGTYGTNENLDEAGKAFTNAMFCVFDAIAEMKNEGGGA